jgi:hypothetical protein
MLCFRWPASRDWRRHPVKRLTPHASNTNLPSRSFCTLVGRSHPHTDLGAQRLQLPKMRPSWPCCFVQKSASLRHVEMITSLILQYRSDSDFPTEEATVNSVTLLFAKRFGVLSPDSCGYSPPMAWRVNECGSRRPDSVLRCDHTTPSLSFLTRLQTAPPP